MPSPSPSICRAAGVAPTLALVLALGGAHPLDAQCARGGAPAVTAATATPAQFAQLRWLDGAWRGRLPAGGFFYERYTVADDSTIQMAHFRDSTLTSSVEGSRIRLRDGVVRYENVAAVRIEESGIAFVRPDGTPGFTWERNSAGGWTATICGRDPSARPEVYLLEPYHPADQPRAEDREQVRRAVLDYIEGFYEGDSTRLLRSVWPRVFKYGYQRADEDGVRAYREVPFEFPTAFMKFAADVRAGRWRPPPDAPKDITVFEVLDQVASAKLVADWGTDYLLLAKVDGRWMITHVLWQEIPRE